jgi:hypothetical protein
MRELPYAVTTDGRSLFKPDVWCLQNIGPRWDVINSREIGVWTKVWSGLHDPDHYMAFQTRERCNLVCFGVVMKKPKKKKTKLVVANSTTIIVDDGKNKVSMPHRVSLMDYYSSDLIKVFAWCEKTYEPTTWRVSTYYPGYIYFAKASDLTMFILRWS